MAVISSVSAQNLPWIISLTLLQIPAAKSLKKGNSNFKKKLHPKKMCNSMPDVIYLTANLTQHCVFPYFDCAEKLAAANIAASTSTLSWESRLWRILWWAFFLSGMMDAKLPSILNKKEQHGNWVGRMAIMYHSFILRLYSSAALWPLSNQHNVKLNSIFFYILLP